jgi:hypothetical protein
MIVGTPPVGRGEIPQGFTFPGEPQEALAARDDLTVEDEEAFAHATADPPFEQWRLEAVARTDPKARKIMFHRFMYPTENWVSHREIVEQIPDDKSDQALIAVVNGAEDSFMNLEFIRKVKYSNLWRQCYELDGLQHAPFWGDPKRFITLLGEFCEDAKK